MLQVCIYIDILQKRKYVPFTIYRVADGCFWAHMVCVWIADLDNQMDMKSTTHSIPVIGPLVSQNTPLKGQYKHVLISMLVNASWFMVELINSTINPV